MLRKLKRLEHSVENPLIRQILSLILRNAPFEEWKKLDKELNREHTEEPPRRA